MTFPGESIQVGNYANTSGTPVASQEDIAYRAGASTFTAGDAATLSADMGYRSLVNGDTAGVVVSWAIEVLSGSGTFAGVESGDIAGGGSLGSVSVTGAGTYLLPSTVTLADILGNGDVDLDLECTSGTVVVQQVKLRVWPTAGVVGDWSGSWQPDDIRLDATSWQGSSFTSLVGVGEIVDATGPLVVSDMQTFMRGELAADTIGAATFIDTTTPVTIEFTAAAQQFDGGTPPARSFLGNLGVGVGYLRHPDRFIPDPDGVFGTDWVYPPNEVMDDPDKWDVTGVESWDWWQGQAMLRLGLVVDTVVSGNVHIAVEYVDDVDAPSTSWGSIATGPALSVNTVSGTPWAAFDLPPAEPTGMLRFVGWHDGAFSEQGVAYSVPFGGDPSGVTYYTGDARATLAGGIYDNPGDPTLDRIAYRYTPAAFRYWVPTATAPRRSVLRHVTRNDGLTSTAPRRWGQESSYQSGRVGGYV